ncbi:calcium-dependent protein kinase 14-like [Helianthus annuus]|uniref:calcium-dependent protein kinase 14-like n=1 Tax=Helianthus annuus TaxID=4232 RepID=UPI000B900FB2|nr:calcium-dependent protein kinase 14-like [Helianthus annuus]
MKKMHPVVRKLLFSEEGSNSDNNQQPDDAIEVFSPPHETDPKYTLGEKLGEGTFGETYICTHTLTGDVFACKTVNKCLTKAYDANVKREITIMKKFSHRNIMTLNDAYQDDDTFYIVMELCSCGTLGDHMKLKGRYTETEAANIIRQVVEALKW